jgi:hypothetical protein
MAKRKVDAFAGDPNSIAGKQRRARKAFEDMKPGEARAITAGKRPVKSKSNSRR